MINAAGILFIDGKLDTGKILLVKRAIEGKQADGLWAFPGGKIEEGETSEQAAVRETQEEIGIDANDFKKVQRIVFARRQRNDVDYTTFLQRVPKQFDVELNDEHTDAAWVNQHELPANIHPGAAAVISKLQMNELDIARAMKVDEFTSPQEYANVTLFNIRITGTGTAYRGKSKEFVYRAPEDYLTEDFLARCNGLPVIVDHPETVTLTSKEFHDRSVGTVFLPYIKGDEVWAIVKIYDDATIEMLKRILLSTSPAVVFRHKSLNQTVELDDGSTLLVEGKPSVLDHIAICENGVWDKGGEPTGVISTHTEDQNMAEMMDDKARKDAEERDEDKKLEKADADGDMGTKLDKLLSFCDTLNSRMDSFEENMKKGDKKKADSEGGDKEEEYLEKKEENEKEKIADKKKGDAETEGLQDGEIGDKKADKKKADDEKIEKAIADSSEARKKIADLEKRMPKDESDEEHAAMADCQATADRVYSAFGDSAPRPLNGESLMGYRRRLAKGLQKHSTAWKDIPLAALDNKVLSVAESVIYADAMVAAHNPTDLPEGELREIIKQDQTGRRVSTFVGRPSAWMGGMMAQRRRLTKINNSSNR